MYDRYKKPQWGRVLLRLMVLKGYVDSVFSYQFGTHEEVTSYFRSIFSDNKYINESALIMYRLLTIKNTYISTQ